ncbi:hypothetical protein SB748_27470 [Rhizobium sp. SIMBA_035]
MSAFARMLLFVFLLAPLVAHASGDDWQVAKATSQVKYTTDQKQWTDLRAGDVVPNKAWISTGPRGRAQLVRGVESIGFQPNTLAAITTKPGGFLSPRKTEIFQQVGELDLEIEKRSQPHTTVQTPYLAAVVKGTIFHVTVGKSKASVAVDRGLVQVTSFASGQQANVGPRQSATVDRKAGMDVAGAVSKPSITSVAPSVAVVPAVGAKKLSGEPDAAPDDKGKSKKGADDTSANTVDDGKGKSNSGKGGNPNGNGEGGKAHDSGKGDGGKGNGGGNGNGRGNGGGKGDGDGGGKGNGNGNGGSKGNDGGKGNAGGNGGGKGNGGGNGNGGGKGSGGKGGGK